MSAAVRSDGIDKAMAAIGHAFQNQALLLQALTHASAQDGKPDLPINERLEFLGDRVLGIVIAARLYQAFPHEGENGLAPRFNAVVNRTACARAARRMGLGPLLRLSPAEDRSGGRDKEAILGDACEAVIAAVYLDAGFAAAEAFVLRHFSQELAAVNEAPQDPKTALQEWAAAQRFAQPRYEVIARSGPDHAPLFVVEAQAPPASPARGEGTSKREAERAAARTLLLQAGVNV
jgi:ribonuclease III